MPFGNRSDHPEITEQMRTALATELQQAGRFEVVVAPLDVEAASSKQVLSSGRFDELEAIRLSRRFQAQGILYGVVTQYHPYSPPRIGVSLLMVSPAEAVVVASVDGLFDAREQSTVDAAADYYNRTQSFPLSLLGSDRVTESPDVFRRFVSHEIAKSLATVAAPTVPPGRLDQGPASNGARRPATVWSNEDRQERTGPRMERVEELSSPTSQLPTGQLPGRRSGEMGQRRIYGEIPESGSPVAWYENREPSAGQTDSRVTHVFMNPRLTGGRNFDSNPGDDGIRIVLEPRNVDGKFVPRAGDLSIVALDPAERGTAARVARWDLQQSQLAPLLRTSEVLGRGFHLKLLWPGEPPRHSELQLYARYVTEDGRSLEADQRIFVDLSEHGSVNLPPSYSVEPPLAIDPPHSLNPVYEADSLPVLMAPSLRAASRRSDESVPTPVERYQDHPSAAKQSPPTVLDFQRPNMADPPPEPPRELVLPAIEAQLRSSRATRKSGRGSGQFEAEVSQNPRPFLPNSNGQTDVDGQEPELDGRILVDPSAVRPDIACLSPFHIANPGEPHP